MATEETCSLGAPGALSATVSITFTVLPSIESTLTEFSARFATSARVPARLMARPEGCWGSEDQPGPTPRLLTVREAAKVLRVSAATVYGLCSKGSLRHIRVSNSIRIPETSIGEMLLCPESSADET
jgi:excisionase family DNA binding protein